jgi:hypothetical protein
MNMDPAFRGERLVLGPDDFSYPEPYAGAGAPAICRDGLIAYEAARHRAIAEPVLFFGPYIDLEAGVYLFRFDGHVEGVLAVRFTHRCGLPLKQVALADFRAPLCLVLRRPVSAFEVVGEKTPSLTALRIAAVLVERVAGAPRPGAAA